MRWTFRFRLRAIVTLTAFTLAAMLVTDFVTMRMVDREMHAIEGDYLPLLDLGPAMLDGVSAIGRSLQESVAAQDREAQAATRTQKNALLAKLDNAPPIVDREALGDLRRSIDAWYGDAYSLSARLMHGETGEAIVSAAEEMQAKQRHVLQLIDRTVVLDRSRLALAFADARRVESLAAWVRMAVPAVLTAAVTVLALGLSRQLISAMHALGAGFDRFGRGDFRLPIPVPGRNELGDAAIGANRMAGSLKALDEQLRLRQAELERANKELEAFSYSVSHDLRAPLRSIDGFSQVLIEDFSPNLPAEAQEHLNRVRAAAQRMATLIDDMLRLSRVTRGEMHIGPIDVTTLARNVVAGLRERDPDRQVAVDIQDNVRMTGDGQLIGIVLENLLGNAWKFASKVAHPRIEAGLTTLDGRQTFYVRDNGAGFDATYASKLFTPFQRLHAVSEFPGTGIGLATVQRIVHRHGGEVWAEGAVGKGATFYFSLSPKGDVA